MTQNTRKGGIPISHDSSLTAGGICVGEDTQLTVTPPQQRGESQVGNLPGQSAPELLGREWNHFVPSR